MLGQVIVLHITDRCQLNCDHCLRDPELKANDLPVELVESILDQARDMYRADAVSITGGEPSLHPHFTDIVDAIVDRGLSYRFITNGRGFSRALARLDARPSRLENLTRINFSLDGATEETHDGIREKGSFRDVMRAAMTVRARGIPFGLITALHARNVHELEDFALLASDLGAVCITFTLTQPAGTFLDRTMYLPLATWKAVGDRIDRLSQTFSIGIYGTTNWPKASPWFTCDPFTSEFLHVDFKGRLTLCCQHAGVPCEGEPRDVLGDLREISLAEGHRRMERLTSELKQKRIDDIEAGLEDWDMSPCNWCLKQFKRPHWVEDGVGGPQAARQRWRGAWAPGYKESHKQASTGPAEAHTDGAQAED